MSSSPPAADPLALIRGLVADDLVFDEMIAKYPRSSRGGLHPGLIPALVESGALNVGALVEAVSDLPVRPEVTSTSGVRYSEVVKLGAGAMGEVHLVQDRWLGRYLARKTLLGRAAHDAASRGRFRHEAAITAQLDHPSIVSVHDFGEDKDGELTYVMKLVRGQTLEDLLYSAHVAEAQKRPAPGGFDVPRRLATFLQVCDAMAHAHARGIVHRDLKPENVMVGRYGQVLVMDWGIARVMGGAEPPIDGLEEHDPEGDGRRTAAGTAIGTPVYMSPEQARGENESLDGRSDLYTLGLILYELVTLKRGRSGNKTFELLFKAQEGGVEPVRHAVRGRRVPRGLAAIIQKATQFEKDRRYPDVEALADDVRRYLRDEPIKARPDSLSQALGRWTARHRTATLMVVMGLLLAVLAIALLGVASAVTVNEVNRWAADQREQRMEATRNKVDAQARAIRRELHRFESLARQVAGASEQALRAPPPDIPTYPAEAWNSAETAPPDLRFSQPWKDKVSFIAVDIITPPGTEATEARNRQLASLAPAFRRTMVTSWGADAQGLDDEAERALLHDKGAPLIWVYIATKEGQIASFPGADSADFEPDYDPREQEWYKDLATGKGIVWSMMDADESGLGLLLTCGVQLLDDNGEFQGVAAVDVTFAYVITRLLEPKGLPSSVETWLLDDQGRVVVRSSQQHTADGMKGDWVPPAFPYPELLQAMRSEGSAGTLEHDIDGVQSVAFWQPLEGVGWTYLVTGPSGDLL